MPPGLTWSPCVWKFRRVEAIRHVVIGRLRIAVRRQLVDQADLQHVAGPRGERRPGRHAVVATGSLRNTIRPPQIHENAKAGAALA